MLAKPKPRDPIRRHELASLSRQAPGSLGNEQHLSQSRVPPSLRPLAPKAPTGYPRGIEKTIKRRGIQITDVSRLEVAVGQLAAENKPPPIPTFTERPAIIMPSEYTLGLSDDAQSMSSRPRGRM